MLRHRGQVKTRTHKRKLTLHASCRPSYDTTVQGEENDVCIWHRRMADSLLPCFLPFSSPRLGSAQPIFYPVHCYFSPMKLGDRVVPCRGNASNKCRHQK